MITIDTHQHFWEINRFDYSWMSEESPLKNDRIPNNLKPLIDKANVSYTVTKNTLTKIAVKNAGYENLFDNILEGQIGTVTTTDDSVAPARIIKNFNKENNDIIEVVGLYADGNLYGPDKYKDLANLPTREELIGKFASMLNQPMTQFAGVLNATMTKLAGVLGSLKEQKN